MARNPALDDYLTRNSREDQVLAQVSRETGEMAHGGMKSRADAGALLTILVRMLDAKTAVEVGTFTGYGAIRIARGLAENGTLTCLEVSDEYAEIARRNIEKAGLQERVNIVVGPAQQSIEQLPDELDFVYVDADKTGYPAYYEALVPRLRSGGLLALDNTLLGERVLDPQDERTRTMDALNQRIAEDDRVESVLLGLSDGVTLALKR
jgi:caffeoyl-CoA O-methyltransferase